jgi:calcium permeable stress-gated cation channel
MSPYHAKRLSSRTVLFANVPSRYLDEQRTRKLFGDTVKNVWIPKDTDDLEKLVKERDQTARRLEKAEIRLIKLANELRRKHMEAADQTASMAEPPPLPLTVSAPVSEDLEKGEGLAGASATTVMPVPALPDVNGSVAAQWVPAERRPSHRPLANYFRRVDTIKWTRNRLRILRPQIRKLRRSLIKGDGSPLGAVFVEFSNQADAERAFQTVTHHRPFHMSPRYIGVRPDEIVWDSLRLGWGQRIVRRFAVLAMVTFGIIFWSIPAAIVGAISNVESIAKFVPILFWLPKLPGVIVGVIQGLLPALTLTLLMRIVPFILRGCGRLMGLPSLSMIELFVQSSYFAFQVVQVFLITTLTSAASSSVMSIIEDPLSTKDLLSQNLPKASNFYISYILVMCMAVGATSLVHIFDLFRHQIMAKSMSSPRMMFNIWNRVKTMHWGGLFPIFTNLGVIAISYSCIAPLILGFSTAGMMFIYVIYRYNLLFIYNTNIDTRGLVYPKALLQLLMGLYLAEVCMIGLFAIQKALGPMILMIAFFIACILIHMSLDDAVSPLLYNLPRTLALESEEKSGGGRNFAMGKEDAVPDSGKQDGNPSTVVDDDESSDEEGDDQGPEHIVHGTRAVEGADTFASTIFDFSKGAVGKRIKERADALGLHHIYGPLVNWISPDPSVEPNFALRWLHPGIFDDFHRLQEKMLPPEHLMPDPTMTYPADYPTRAYWPPVMSTPLSKLWIPRDEAGVSAQEVAHSSKVIEITDEGAWLDENGKVTADMEKAPFWEPRILY